jgi:DNA-binding winged helix-turn-helix (wHTH) protein/Tfp pilus assembly protein PilF/TolB-like protein
MSLDLKSNLHQINLSLVKPSSRSIYEFDDYRLEAEHLMLYRGGTAVSLTPKQVETLLALVEKKGQIVSKDDLMARLWGDSAVEESNLIQNIYVLRKTLGLSSDGRPVIETFRRRGYRFNGVLKRKVETVPNLVPLSNGNGVSANKVELLTTESGSHYLLEPERTAPTPPPKTLPGKKTLVIVGVSLALAAIVIAVIAITNPALQTTAGKKRSVAVLPVKPIQSSVRDDVFEMGIAESLIHRLSLPKDVNVRPLSETRKYVDLTQDAVAAGRELSVDFVVSSSYQVADGKVRVTAQLIDVASGNIEETMQSSEVSVENVFTMQDIVAGDIGTLLLNNKRLGPDSPGLWWQLRKYFPISIERLEPAKARFGTENEEAYRLYLEGMTLIDRGSWSFTEKAQELLQRAVKIDPNYAQAWAAIARAKQFIPGVQIKTQDYLSARDAINKALSIDPELADAYVSQCHISMFYEFDPARAEKACKRAIELDPNSSEAYMTYNVYLVSRGRLDEAFDAIETAISLSPASFKNQRQYANTLASAGRFPEAEQQFKALIETNPTNISVHRRLIRVLEAEGKEAEALDYLIKLMPLEGKDASAVERVKKVYAESGWRGVLGERIRMERSEKQPDDFKIAEWLAALGEKDKAFKSLEAAFRNRNSFMILLRGDSHHLDPLRSDPRFDDLIRRVEEK